MNKLKKLYRDFFGLREEVGKIETDDPKQAEDMAKKGLSVKLVKPGMSEDLDEAQLINNITDYRGGVEYVLRDPEQANSVAQEIRDWAESKGFTVITHEISPTGKVGYFYFRLGQDPAHESQRIQGYIAQKPEVKHFRFNIKNKKPLKRKNNPQDPRNI